MGDMQNITFRPTLKQFQAWEYLNDAETTELGWGGGAGGGKSYLGCFWILSHCLAYPGTRWLIGRKELVNLKRTTLNTFFKVCSEYGILVNEDFSINQQTNVVRFRNGSEILLFDLASSPADPDYTRLGGLELTGAFVDESNEVEEKAITILKTRLGRQLNDKYGLLPRVLETFNPSKSSVFTRYYKPWKSNSLPSYRKFIRALVTDNPHATPEYIQQLERGDRVTRERLLHGNFEYDDDPWSLISFDAVSDLFTNTAEDSDDKYIVCDAARLGGDLITITVWEGLFAYRCQWSSRLPLDVTAQTIKQIAAAERVPWSHILVDEDGLGGGLVDMLKGVKGFVGSSTPIPRSIDGKPEPYLNLRSQCFHMLAEAVERRRMAVRLDDPQMRERMSLELQQVKRKAADTDAKHQVISKADMKVALGHSPDWADNLMMRMFFDIQGKKTPRQNEREKGWMEREMEENRNSSRKTLAQRL